MGKKSTHNNSADSSKSISVGSRSYVDSPEGFAMEVQGTPRPSKKKSN